MEGSGAEDTDPDEDLDDRNDLDQQDEDEDLENPTCRHGEHYDEAEKVCKCGSGQSCEGSNRPYCLDGRCKGDFC